MNTSKKEKPFVITLVGEAMVEKLVTVPENFQRNEKGEIIFSPDQVSDNGIAGDVVPNMAKYVAHMATHLKPSRPVEIRIVTGAKENGDAMHQNLAKLQKEFKGTNVSFNFSHVQNTGIDFSTYYVFKNKDGKTVNFREGEGFTPERFNFVGRENGAAANMLNEDGKFSRSDVIIGSDLVVTSAIFQIVSKNQGALIGLIEEAGKYHARSVYSTNLRPKLWENKYGSNWKSQAIKLIDYDVSAVSKGGTVFTSLADEVNLRSSKYTEKDLDIMPESKNSELMKAVAKRISKQNPNLKEIVITNGINKGAVYEVGDAGSLKKIASIVPNKDVKAVDTTGAGDSFMAAYLMAREVFGLSAKHSAMVANSLSESVIQHAGGNVAREKLVELSAAINTKPTELRLDK